MNTPDIRESLFTDPIGVNYIYVFCFLIAGILFAVLWNEVLHRIKNKERRTITHYLFCFAAAGVTVALYLSLPDEMTGGKLPYLSALVMGFSVSFLIDLLFIVPDKSMDKYKNGGEVENRYKKAMDEVMRYDTHFHDYNESPSFPHCPNCGAPLQNNECSHCGSKE